MQLPWVLLFILSLILFWKYDKQQFNKTDILTNLWVMTRMYYFSISITFITTVVIKLFCGTPRPNLFAIMEQVEDENDFDVWNARQSFLSGHSSLAMSTMGLLTIMFYQSWIYSQSEQYEIGKKLGKCCNPYQYYLADFWYLLRNVPLIASLLIFAPVCIALYCGISRITDYKHTRIDVCAGELLGACCAYLAYLVYYNETFLHFKWRLMRAA